MPVPGPSNSLRQGRKDGGPGPSPCVEATIGPCWRIAGTRDDAGRRCRLLCVSLSLIDLNHSRLPPPHFGGRQQAHWLGDAREAVSRLVGVFAPSTRVHRVPARGRRGMRPLRLASQGEPVFVLAARRPPTSSQVVLTDWWKEKRFWLVFLL